MIRTQTVLVRTDPIRNLGQRELLVPKNIWYSEFGYDLDGIRFMEASDERHADI